MAEERLDKIIMARNLVSNRVEAEKTIKEIGVKVNGRLITKPGKKFDTEASIELLGVDNPYVNLNGLKLKKAIEAWDLSIENKTALDIGAGVGGCTEVLIEENVASVTTVDKEIKLDTELSNNEKIKSQNSIAFRELNTNILPDLFDICIIDINTTKLEETVPFVQGFVKSGGDIIAFFKPQVEADKKEVNKIGALKDNKAIPLLLHYVKKMAENNQLDLINEFESPILGECGNREYLLHLKKR